MQTLAKFDQTYVCALLAEIIPPRGTLERTLRDVDSGKNVLNGMKAKGNKARLARSYSLLEAACKNYALIDAQGLLSAAKQTMLPNNYDLGSNVYCCLRQMSSSVACYTAMADGHQCGSRLSGELMDFKESLVDLELWHDNPHLHKFVVATVVFSRLFESDSFLCSNETPAYYWQSQEIPF